MRPSRLDRLTAEELAGELRVKISTVRAWQLQGMPYQPAGRLRFYDLMSVEAWLRERDQTRRVGKSQPCAA